MVCSNTLWRLLIFLAEKPEQKYRYCELAQKGFYKNNGDLSRNLNYLISIDVIKKTKEDKKVFYEIRYHAIDFARYLKKFI